MAFVFLTAAAAGLLDALCFPAMDFFEGVYFSGGDFVGAGLCWITLFGGCWLAAAGIELVD